jgi:hypothetical protein
MTPRPAPRAPTRVRAARPAAALFQRSLTAWFAEWKDRKDRTTAPAQPPSRPPSAATATSP